jgi:hypothetical protein
MRLGVALTGVLACAATAAAVDFTWSGDVQYRLRYERTYITDEVNDALTVDTIKSDYTNRYAWNLKLGAAINENLMIGLRLSNPLGSGTENISDNISQLTVSNYNLVAIPEMYLKFTAWRFSLLAGIIPVPENAVLNLTVYEDLQYVGVGSNPWGVLMNNSQKGIALGLEPVKNESIVLGINFLSAIGRDRTSYSTAGHEFRNLDQMRFMLSVPVQLPKAVGLTVTPILHYRTAIRQAMDSTTAANPDNPWWQAIKRNDAVAAGIDVGISQMMMLDVKYGFAIGGYDNTAARDSATVTQIAPLGMLETIALTLRTPAGVSQLDVTQGMSMDRRQNPVKHNSTIFVDVKHGIPIRKFTIQPRVRFWAYFNDRDADVTVRWRPELILKAAF